MMNVKLCTSLAAAATVALLAACAGTGTDVSSPMAAPGGASLVLTPATAAGETGNNTPNQGEVEVCKYGTNATFRVGPTGGSTTTFEVADGTCKVVVVDKTTGSPANSYTIQEVASSSYELQSILRTDIQFAANTTTDVTSAQVPVSDPVVALINAFHGVHLVYHNNPVTQTGCTYTKGWYRNNGSSTVIAVDGRSIAEAQAIFKATPGKPNGVTWGADNNNLNLYQQLLAALNNLNGDATGGPDAVDQAIADALAATSGSGLNIIVAAGTDVSGLISVLSAFNEGTYRGWPHCGDEIL